ncbi:hypothetical protein [Sphingomonas oligophenolica]|uniref:Uncharacterized protein n=1 Tax=Sphingomonas oligophenolica TaxID=301154 RepID=A0A502CL30_9SPHN|nr:hypothetical protein [Sphingomonas oligophenolica]TPG14365.1 hypothetical protein EAH84_03390 [Sphingomonas oligophenolica]
MASKKKPASGYHRVDLARAWDDPLFPDFRYKPSHDIRVDDATLARMRAEPGLVTSAVADA